MPKVKNKFRKVAIGFIFLGKSEKNLTLLNKKLYSIFCIFAYIIILLIESFQMKFIAIIPARYASTRFPAKPLAILGGKAVMTRTDHKSGTDRIQEAVEKIKTDADVIINIQGDEPFIQSSQIETICQQFDDANTQIATLGKFFSSMEEVKNPNSPKIILDVNHFALYFSRSIVPFIRGEQKEEWIKSFPFLKHLGIYAYRRQVLKEITQLPQSPLEIAESLEQLRWLQNGYRIRVGITDVETVGIDTPDDLKRAEDFLKNIEE